MEVDYKTIWLMVHKFRADFKDRDSLYMPEHNTEMDDAFFCGSSLGQGGYNTKVTVSVENHGKKAGLHK